MRSDRERRALTTIVDHVVLARSWVGDLDPRAFAEDRKTFYAVTRCLEIISEAARRLNAETRDRHPHIPWRQLMDAGNVYRHDYDNVVEARVWRAVHDRLPEMVSFASTELKDS